MRSKILQFNKQPTQKRFAQQKSSQRLTNYSHIKIWSLKKKNKKKATGGGLSTQQTSCLATSIATHLKLHHFRSVLCVVFFIFFMFFCHRHFIDHMTMKNVWKYFRKTTATKLMPPTLMLLRFNFIKKTKTNSIQSSSFFHG